MSKIGAEVKQAGAESAGKPSKHAWLCVSVAGRQAGRQAHGHPPAAVMAGGGQWASSCRSTRLVSIHLWQNCSLSLQPLISCSSVSLGEWAALCCSEGGESVCE